jgi:hypothetical protein
MAGAPPGAGVNVLGRQRIGPFDVTRLAAQDPTALARWLTDNGFPHPDGLDANLAPYVADRWEIVAVKLAPATEGESLTGDLFILADHRMDPASVPVAGNAPTLLFAGRIEGAEVSPALAQFVGESAFLTRWRNDRLEPASIEGDYVFEVAGADTEYQRVVRQPRNRGDLTGLTLLAIVGISGVAVTVVIVRRIGFTT